MHPSRFSLLFLLLTLFLLLLFPPFHPHRRRANYLACTYCHQVRPFLPSLSSSLLHPLSEGRIQTGGDYHGIRGCSACRKPDTSRFGGRDVAMERDCTEGSIRIAYFVETQGVWGEGEGGG